MLRLFFAAEVMDYIHGCNIILTNTSNKTISSKFLLHYDEKHIQVCQLGQNMPTMRLLADIKIS